MKMSRILPRLMLGFLLLSPLPLAGLAWWANTAFEQALRRTVLSHLSSIADKKADQINSYLEERLSDARSLAKSPAAQHALRVLPSLLASSEGAQYQTEEARYRDYFRAAYDNGGDYDLLLTAADGNVVFSILHEADFGSNLNTGRFRDSILAQAHRQALLLLTSQITPAAAYAPSDFRPSVFIVAPVMQDGQPIGSVALQVALEQLTEVTTDGTGLGDSGETLITQVEDDRALYVTPLRSEKLPTAAFSLRKPIKQLGEAMQAAIRGERGSGVVKDYEGTKVVAAWRYLPTMRWFMVVKMDASEALAPALRLRTQSWIALGVIVLAAWVVALFLARSILRPIRELVTATHRIAAGDLHERAPLIGSEEFRVLGASFNRMAERLADEQATLERRVAERTLALSQSNARFDDLVRRISAGIYVFRMRAAGGVAFEYLSPRACELLAVSADAALRDPGCAFARIHADDLPEMLRRNAHAAATLEPFRLECRFCFDSGIRWYRIESEGARQDNGDSLWNGVITDVTERKQIELALRQASEEQSAIFESATLGICLLRDRIVVKCNHRLEEMLGYAPGELLGHTTREWYLSEADYLAGGEIYHELEAGGIHRRDQELKRRDGSRFICRLAGRAIDPNDLSQGSVWLFDDVTQERRIAAEMEAARRAAEAANRAKSEFLANMSHEIRTPMNAVLGLTQLVLDGKLEREQRDFLETTMASGRALLGILNDILDYSKIEAGRMEVERVPLSVEALLHDVADLFSARLQEKPLALHLDLDPQLPARVMGDPLRLTQVLNNLVGNAIKFTERGEIIVRAEVAQREGDALRLRITVRDSGIGLSPDQAARLFDAFTQADSSVTRKHGGTGLGLAICKKLVALMGGDISVSSVQGQGATFSFTIAVQALADAPSGVLPAAAVPAATARYEGARVLLVEDNAQNQQVAAGFLARRGIEVVLAGHGGEALDALAQARFDLILMDLHMPVMDGIEAARRIRALPDCAELPIVAMTAAVMPEDRARCAAAGMDDFVAKPIEPEVFDLVLARWLRQTGFAARVPAPLPPGGPSTDGFDNAAALRRLEGDAALLQRLQHQFAVQYADAPAALATMLAEGQSEAAIARLHAIKGAAGNLGAVALAQAAGELELALRNGGDAQPLLPAFADALAHAIAWMCSDPAPRVPQAAPASDPALLRAALDALRPYLEQRELPPDPLLDRLRQMVLQEPAAGLLHRLLRQIDQFDQDGALGTAAQLIARLETEARHDTV